MTSSNGTANILRGDQTERVNIQRLEIAPREQRSTTTVYNVAGDQETPQTQRPENEGTTLTSTDGDRTEYVVDKIFQHRLRKSADSLSLEYLVQWLGFSAALATWKPTHHLRRSQLSRYYRRIRQPLPADIALARSD